MRALRNSGIGQLVFGGIVVSIILAFVLQSRVGNTGMSFDDECAIKVGKSCIDPKEYYAAFGLTVTIGTNGLPERAVKQLRLHEKVARGLAERQVLLAEAKRLGIGASEDAVNADIVEGRVRVSLPASGENALARQVALCIDGPNGCEPSTLGLRTALVQRGEGFDFEVYKKWVRNVTARSPNHFKDMQVAEATAARVRELVRSQVRVSEEEAFLMLERVRSEATLRLVRAEGPWFERFFAAPTSGEVSEFAKGHEKEITDAIAVEKEKFPLDCRAVSELLLPRKDDETDEALLARAKTLAGTLSTDSAFEKAARESSAADSAALGGRLGCVPASEPELSEAAKKLAKVGEVGAPVVSFRGATLLRLQAIVTAENRDAVVKTFVTYRQASAAKGSEAARKFASALLDAAKKGEALEAATEKAVEEMFASKPAADHPALTAENRPKLAISSPFSRDGSPVADASPGQNVAEIAFGLEKNDTAFDSLVSIPGGFVVAQLKDKDVYSRDKFQAARDKVMGQLRAQKAEEVLAAYVDRLIKKAGGVTYNSRYVPSDDEKPSPKKDAPKKAG